MTDLFNAITASRKLELHHIDGRLGNLKAMNVLAAGLVLAGMALGALDGSRLGLALSGLGVVLIIVCLVGRYRLIQARDRVGLALLDAGIAKAMSDSLVRKMMGPAAHDNVQRNRDALEPETRTFQNAQPMAGALNKS